MSMIISPNEVGGYRLSQTLVRPVVYLDHWAIRLFSENQALQGRFLEALHRAKGTWLFSTANLMEFIAMADLGQAKLGEELLLKALPNLYFADMTIDKGFLLEEGAEEHPDAPDRHWMLTDLAHRAAITEGEWNTHRFLQDAILYGDQLLTPFQQMKADISEGVMALTQDAKIHAQAMKFRPSPGMTLRQALYGELLRDPHLNAGYAFSDHDAMDFLHAAPSAVVCDYVLLDAGWCHKVERATKRLRRGGVTGRIAPCYSQRVLPNFFVALEGWKEA